MDGRAKMTKKINRMLSDEDLALIQSMRQSLASYHSNYLKSGYSVRSFEFLGKIDERFGTVGDEGKGFRVKDAEKWASGAERPPW